MSALQPARLATATALGALLSTVGNLVVYFAAGAASPIRVPDQANPGSFMDLPVAIVVVASVVPALFGAGLYAALRTFAAARANAVFTGICVVVTVLSMAGPVGAPDTLSKLALAVMHVVSAVAIGGALVRRG